MCNNHLRQWNGGFHTSEHIDVYVKVGEDTQKRGKAMAKSFIQCQLGVVLTKPEDGKWTKFTPGNEWLYGTLANNNMLLHLMKEGVTEFKIDIHKIEEIYFGGVAFHAKKRWC